MIRMGDDWSPEGYALCAAKVVEQAVQDYRRALRQAAPSSGGPGSAGRKRLSASGSSVGIWGCIHDLDGEAIIREIKARVRREVGRR